MPLISSNSESTTSAIKTRFRYKIQPQQEPIEPQNALFKSSSSPDLSLKSALRDSNILVQSSCYKERSLNLDEDEEISCTTARSFEFRLDPSFWKEHNIQVIIRVRPLSSAEISLQGHSRCVKQDNSQSITWIGHPESRFTFDLVADETVTQENLFKVAGVPMVENCMEGYNSCMFAYGQTGSGKTHTMLGDIEGGTRRHSVNCGMTPRVFEYLFSRIQKEKDVRREEKLNFTCRCSFLEIYNEQILDLLEPSSVNLQIREDIKKGVYVENLKEVEVTSARDVIQQLIQGSANRKVAATNMNRASSRSHSVFTCIIESKWESQGVTHRRFAHLNLVDLAGSERQKSSGAEGERLKEATNINKSLSTLGLVIMNLVSISSGKSLHVPYRDSKLTFLLQDSLGGNAKTTIIANISPANCCSLETLSTLKFAQRAKFIKNHAIVNEDTSGDVLALKIENQNLKKEVSRLRSLVNGGAANGDALPLTFPVSPGSSFKWDTSRGFSSPLISEKKTSHLQKKEHEMALVGALRREKDKDAALQVLAAEKQAALQLAKQREEEVQGLKMRLRFREAAVKRLEAVASGKIQADMHLLKEKEEHLKEIDALRAQIERNPEVTRFAMENLQLKEEIARLKAFCEEGQRESMTEQIMILESKLLEALDWKLMHESDTTDLQKSVSTLSTSMNEENEFLRIQAIQKQSELESLRKKLDFCLEEKANIERHASDLAKELEAELLSKQTLIGNNDQTEIKTMVDAIAAATQKETEAHEMAMRLSDENEELRMKLKVLIEDNNKLIDLYERAVVDNKENSGNDSLISEEELVRDQNCCHSTDEVAEDSQLEMKGEIDSLKRQLAEMHEENDKLLTLYEKAMQERDEFKRVIASGDSRIVKGSSFQEKCDGGLRLTFEEAPPISIDEYARKHKGINEQLVRNDDTDLDDMQINPLIIIGSSLEEAHLYEIYVHEDGCNESAISFEAKLAENGISEETVVDKMETDQLGEFEEQEHTVHLLKDLDSIQRKLVEAQEKLSDSSEMISQFGSIEESIIEVGSVSEKICEVEHDIHSKQLEYEALKSLSSDLEERKAVANKKLMALKHSLMSFSSSVSYFEQHEDSARSELEDSLQHVTQRKEQISRLQAIKQELKGELSKLKQIDNDLRISLENTKMRLGEENKKIESERVLLPIDNADKRTDDIPQRSWQTAGKALELLKSEEEKMKLQNQIKLQRERIGDVRKEAEAVKVKLSKVYSDLQVLETEMQKEVASVGALDRKLQSIVAEKQMLLEVQDNARSEFDSMIVEYYQSLFESELKVEEVKIMKEELVVESQKLEGLQRVKDEAVMRKNQLLEDMSCDSNTVSDMVKSGLLGARNSVAELSFMLQNFS